MVWVREGLAVLLVSAVAAAGPAGDVRAWRKAHEAEIVRELADLVALPNLAREASPIRANANHLVAMLTRRGMATRLLEVEGAPPAVYGERRVPGARRTIVFYAHYDSQPVDPAKWHGEPWKPILRDRGLEDGGGEIPLDRLP